MKYVFSIILLFAISSCSTTATHVGSVKKTETGHEYSIKDTTNGFIVAGHYNEYQFVRNSRSGFTGCMTVINSAARDYAKSLNKDIELPEWDDIEIIDHGRDIITATMNVNCKYEYKFVETDKNIIDKS